MFSVYLYNWVYSTCVVCDKEFAFKFRLFSHKNYTRLYPPILKIVVYAYVTRISTIPTADDSL